MLTAQLQHYLAMQERSIQVLGESSVMVMNESHQEVVLDLSPQRLEPQDVTAQPFFF